MSRPDRSAPIFGVHDARGHRDKKVPHSSPDKFEVRERHVESRGREKARGKQEGGLT